MRPPSPLPAYQESPEVVLVRLGTDPALGLTTAEAAARLRQYGLNELMSPPSPPAWRRLVAQFQSPLVLLLLVATLVSFVVWLIERESELPFEAIAILAIVLLNAALGFIQEERAERSVAALRAMAAAMATVIRDGQHQKIPAREVVPGDILLVEEGDTIAADARLIEVIGLQVSEAALTGESLPVAKSLAVIHKEVGLGDRRNMLFAGTAATYGRARAVVTATGMQTEMGKIAGLLQRTEDAATPLQTEIERVGRALGAAVILIAVVIIAAVFLTQQVTTVKAVVDVLIVGVSLAVAAVPEGLATVLTIVLALGMQRMARRNAIVRKLAAVETLGSANVICTDKTGTLTRNEMTVRTVVTASGRVEFCGSGYAPEARSWPRMAGRSPIRSCAPRSNMPCALPIWPTTACCSDVMAAGSCRRPDGRRAARRSRQARLTARCARAALHAHRRSAVFLGAQADEHGARRRTKAGARSDLCQGRAGCVAGPLLRGAHRRRHAPANRRPAS